jgi:hypothetical protein
MGSNHFGIRLFEYIQNRKLRIGNSATSLSRFSLPVHPRNTMTVFSRGSHATRFARACMAFACITCDIAIQISRALE